MAFIPDAIDGTTMIRTAHSSHRSPRHGRPTSSDEDEAISQAIAQSKILELKRQLKAANQRISQKERSGTSGTTLPAAKKAAKMSRKASLPPQQQAALR